MLRIFFSINSYHPRHSCHVLSSKFSTSRIAPNILIPFITTLNKSKVIENDNEIISSSVSLAAETRIKLEIENYCKDLELKYDGELPMLLKHDLIIGDNHKIQFKCCSEVNLRFHIWCYCCAEDGRKYKRKYREGDFDYLLLAIIHNAPPIIAGKQKGKNRDWKNHKFNVNDIEWAFISMSDCVEHKLVDATGAKKTKCPGYNWNVFKNQYAAIIDTSVDFKELNFIKNLLSPASNVQ